MEHRIVGVLAKDNPIKSIISPCLMYRPSGSLVLCKGNKMKYEETLPLVFSYDMV
jgi:hypothetical protein